MINHELIRVEELDLQDVLGRVVAHHLRLGELDFYVDTCLADFKDLPHELELLLACRRTGYELDHDVLVVFQKLPVKYVVVELVCQISAI